MSIRQWVLAKLRDDEKEAELDAREARSTEAVEGLRAEREANSLGKLFQTATHPFDTLPPALPRHPKE